MDALLQPASARQLAVRDEGHELRRRGLEATLGYGVLLGRGQLVGTPKAAIALLNTHRELKLGWQLKLSRLGAPHFDLGLEGMRQEYVQGRRKPEHQVQLRLGLHW